MYRSMLVFEAGTIPYGLKFLVYAVLISNQWQELKAMAPIGNVSAVFTSQNHKARREELKHPLQIASGGAAVMLPAKRSAACSSRSVCATDLVLRGSRMYANLVDEYEDELID